MLVAQSYTVPLESLLVTPGIGTQEGCMNSVSSKQSLKVYLCGSIAFLSSLVPDNPQKSHTPSISSKNMLLLITQQKYP